MTPFEKIHAYSKSVCSQIRWKKAHTVVSEEIENHLVDQRNAYMADGADEAAATDKAIAQMGDPVTIGSQLDRTHRPKPQWGMLGLISAIMFIGVFMQLFLDMHMSGYVYFETFKPLIYTIFGLVVLTAFYFIDFSWIGKFPMIIYTVSLILITITFVIRMFFDRFGGFFYEPLLFPIGFAGIVFASRNRGYRGIVLCEIAFIVPALMMLILRFRADFILLAVSAFVILCLAVSKGWFGVKKRNGYMLILIPTAVALALAMVYIFQYSYRWEKIMAAFNPSLDPSGEGQLGLQIQTLLSHSHWIGEGTRQGVPPDFQPWNGWSIFFMLTYLIFDLGWIPFLLIMSVLVFFIVKGFMVCFKQTSGLALFVSVSVMLSFTIPIIQYVLLNLGITMRLGDLPFFIYFGHISLFVNMALAGLMLSVFRTGHVIKDNNVLTGHRLISFQNGKLSFSKK